MGRAFPAHRARPGGRRLLHFAPGAPREGCFEGKGEEEKAAFFIRHDTYWLPWPRRR
ncbi:hypothetical protein ABT294_13085 [Nonomuraea sp. NPDC000554]|uniref:hypothetical protein n=1 Tax=Nonomuraea sp. NPDC000554 TaxID=3154259 RepID=UPI00332B1D71